MFDKVNAYILLKIAIARADYLEYWDPCVRACGVTTRVCLEN